MTSAATDTCPNCQTAVRPHDRVCGACGARLDGAAMLAHSQDELHGAEGTRNLLVQFLIFCAVTGGLLGLLFASQATLGAAMVGYAVLLAVLARLAQANAHHAAVIKYIRRR